MPATSGSSTLRSAPPDTLLWRLGFLALALVTAWRVVLLPFNETDLFVDEAQYWLWGQNLDWGYYSKPPLIAWLLRLSTTIGFDAPFWIRLPLPLIHAATACTIGLVARRLFDPGIGGIAAVAYVTLPGVALGSLLVSTDTPLLFFFALAMLAHLRLAERPSLPGSILLGAAIGLGLLSKYAMIYFLLSAAIACALVASVRIPWRFAGVAAFVASLIIAPNLLWNVSNSFATLQHTAENADWQGVGADFSALGEFWLGQLAVGGPVLFVLGFLVLLTARSSGKLYLACMALPVFVIVSAQAVLSGANANWAAIGHLGVTAAAATTLKSQRKWAIVALAFNAMISLALPLAVIFATSLRIGDGELLLDRHFGQAAVSLKALEIAEAEDLDVVVSDNRAFLADFFFTLRDAPLEIYSVPPSGAPKHHYAQSYPLPAVPGDVLFVGKDSDPPVCRDPSFLPVEVATWRAESGYFTGDITAWRVPGSCWTE